MSDTQFFVMVAGIIAALIVSVVGYKVIKRYLSEECTRLRLANGRRTGDVEDDSDQVDHPETPRSSRTGTIRRTPKLTFNFPPVTRAGDSVSFRILLPEPTTRNFFGTLSSYPPSPSGSPRPTRHSQQLSNRIFIRVVNLLQPDADNITVIREFVVDEVTREDVVLATFSVQIAGFYEIQVRHENAHLKNSPLALNFFAAELDPEKTGLLQHSPAIVCKADSVCSMSIEPKDRFGNTCRLEDIDLGRFGFQILHAVENKKDTMDVMTFNFTGVDTDEWGEVNTLVQLETEIFIPGIYKGTLTYGGKLISNGFFDIVALSEQENRIFDANLGNVNTIYHEGKLLSTAEKAKTVFIYVYTRQLVVKSFFLGIIPSRLAVFHITPATRISLLSTNPVTNTSTFKIQDKMQPRMTLEMNTASHRVLMAMFAHFLQERLGGSESFENKQKFFYDEVKSAREEKGRAFIPVKVNRANLIDSSLAETKAFGVKEWCRKFRVQFLGESGMDDGGLRKELLEILCTKMFENNAGGMFCSIGTSRLVHPNPNRSAEWTLKHYEFAGKIVGKCLFETAVGGFSKQMVNGRFSRSFLGQIIGFTPNYKYFELDDPELYLTKVKYILENDVGPMELTFTEEDYQNGVLIKTVDLVPNGSKIPVTNEKKEYYLNALASYRLGSVVRKEIDAFLKGLNEIIPNELLTNFDENELEILMCGKSKFDIQDFKNNHVVTTAESESQKLLRWFWTTVENMTDSERGNLLQFTTGSSLLPHGGFKQLRPTFRITIINSEGKLPIAHTCFNEICLSNHKTYEDFDKALRTGVNETEGFAFM